MIYVILESSCVHAVVQTMPLLRANIHTSYTLTQHTKCDWLVDTSYSLRPNCQWIHCSYCISKLAHCLPVGKRCIVSDGRWEQVPPCVTINISEWNGLIVLSLIFRQLIGPRSVFCMFEFKLISIVHCYYPILGREYHYRCVIGAHILVSNTFQPTPTVVLPTVHCCCQVMLHTLFFVSRASSCASQTCCGKRTRKFVSNLVRLISGKAGC